MDNRTLEVVIKARDEASRVIKGVSDSSQGLSKAFRENIREAGLMSGAVLGALGVMTKAAVDNAAAYEQNRIAFETMLGSAEAAQEMLRKVSDFAIKTPFELPQVVEGAKRLLAYNIEAEKLIPTFRVLGDIAAGVGTDKLPQLILAFGQVKAATRLTGMELRQFSEAGVPLLGALADQLGKTEAEIQDMVSSGEVGFEMVEEALTGMTQEGGKFFNLMDRQSKTFSGVMSNINDEFGRFVRDVVGISATGDIREGSIFAHLRDGATAFLNVLTDVRPLVTRLIDDFLSNRNAVMGLAGALGGLMVAAIVAFIAAFGPAILVMSSFAVAGAAIVLMLGNFQSVLEFVLPQLAAAAVAITAVSLATNGLSGSVMRLWAIFSAHPIGLVITVLGGLAVALGYVMTQTDLLKTRTDLLSDAQDRLKESSDKVRDAQERLKDVYVRLEGAEIAVERAQRNLDQAVKTYGQNSLEVKEAQHQLNSAQRESERATIAAKDAIKEADAAYGTYKENAKAYNETVAAQETAWGRLRDTISSAIGKLIEWNNRSRDYGVGIGVPGFKLPSFDRGGWVQRTGPAIVHQGEFVLSRDMLAGRQQVPGNVSMPNKTVNINMGGVSVRGEGDVDGLAHRLGFYFQTAGDL